jgi:hypothetical protein
LSCEFCPTITKRKKRNVEAIRFNREFDSNVIDENELRDKKHFDPRISTLLGIKIDRSND